jgi:hypothetical protein
MHHFEEFRITRHPRGESFDITYTNEHSGKEIKMNIPETGVFENPERVLTQGEVEQIARDVGHYLSNKLTENLMFRSR